MRRRRIALLTTVVVLIILLAIALSGGEGGPMPKIIDALRNATTSEDVAEQVVNSEAIDLPDTVKPILAQPVSPISFSERSSRFLAYGLNDRQVYLISSNGLGVPVYRHQADENFISASINNDESKLIINVGRGETLNTSVITIDSQSAITAPAGTQSASWMPNGQIVYSRLQDERISLIIANNDFTNTREVGRLPIEYSASSIIPSPEGSNIAVIGQLEDGEGLSAQILSLKENKFNKVGANVATCTWSPDGKFLFVLSAEESINFNNPTMTAWDSGNQKSTTYSNAKWFPITLQSMPDQPGVYWSLRSATDDNDQEAWVVTTIDTNKKQMGSLMLNTSLSGYVGIFGVKNGELLGIGSDTAYKTAVTPVIDAAKKIITP